MGKLIDSLAGEMGHEITHRISSTNSDEINNLSNVDVAIEFTRPDAALANFEQLANQNIPIVTGTTGWMDHYNDVSDLMIDTDNKFFYASNFSIGVHISMAVSIYLTKFIQNFPDYQARIDEWHHTGKKDAPSGTALSFAKEIIKNNKNYESIAFEKIDIQENELPVYAFREGDVMGTHQIKYESDIDSIILRHEAKNRNGFALGALKAAAFLNRQKPGIYTMNDLIKLPL